MTPSLDRLYTALVEAQPATDRELSEDTRAAVRGALVALAREMQRPCPIVTRRERRKARRITP